MTLSMPALNSNWPSNRPAGPAPMMATWVRMWKPPDACKLSRFPDSGWTRGAIASDASSAYSPVTLANNYTVVWVLNAGPKMPYPCKQVISHNHESNPQDHPGRHRAGRQQPRGRANPDSFERVL